MRTADTIIDEMYLEIRAKLLEVAASLDRIERVADEEGPLSDKGKSSREKLDEAIRILLSEGPDRTERLQRLFSREYEPDWRKKMRV